MSEFERFDWRMNRRQALLMGGAACACGSLGRVAYAQQSGLTSCVEVQPWYGAALRNEPVDRGAFLQRSVQAISAAQPAPPRSPAAAPGVAFSPPLSHPVLSGMPGGEFSSTTSAQASAALTEIQQNKPLDPKPRVFEGIISKLLLWPRKSVVYYNFWQGSSPRAFVDAIENAIATWQPICGLTFKRGNNPGRGWADIRVTFAPGLGHYSHVGIQSSDINNSVNRTGTRESLNIDPNGVGGSRDFLLGVALHEVGHAIGLNHEHQHPNDAIRWNRSAVMQHFAQIGWGSQMIQENIFDVLNDPRQYVFTNNRDPLSVMHYWFPPTLYVAGGVPVPQAPINELSATDRRFVAERYGEPVQDAGTGGGAPEVETDRRRLRIENAKRLTAGQVTAGEFPTDPQMHLYKVELSAGGDFVLETVDGARQGQPASSAMPVVIELYGGTDFSESNVIKVSQFGAAGEGKTILGSLGVQDAYLRSPLQSGKSYYVLVRPLQRLASGSAKASYRLLLRQATAARPDKLDEGSWGGLVRGIGDLQDEIKDLQKLLRK